MKRLVGIIVLVSLVHPLSLSAQPPLLAAPPARDPATAAADLIDRLAKGDFQGAAVSFADAMRAAAPPEKLSEIWTALQTQMGPFQQRTGVKVEKQGAYQIALVTTEFERSMVDLKVAFDEQGKIAGFFIAGVRPKPGAGPEYTPPAYVHKDAFQEREVTVGSGDWALPGTLSVPVGTGPFPAVVLVHGSGPNDRDETVGKEMPFRDLAWGLASRGIAVLRYEKRTRVHGAKLAGVTGFTVQQETVDDALAAADLLRHTPGIDPRRVFVLGHSLGGMMIPRIGQRDHELAGLIAMAGLTRPLEDVILEQVSYLAGVDGNVTDLEKQQIESLRGEVAKVKALKAGDTGSALGAPGSYWLDLRGYNPPEAAKELKAPLLILQGERDYQVTMVDFEAWKKALAGRPGVTLKSYPKLNHLFIEGEGKSTPVDYETPGGHVAEAVIADIAGWIKR